MLKNKKIVYVVGHKNPDTDSICSAIAYANLKNKLNKNENMEFEGVCLGKPNNETQFVLDTFGIKNPKVIDSVETQVRDIEIEKNLTVSETISLREAWNLMQESGMVTLTVVNEKGKLQGIVSTNDITKAYMNVYDNKILAESKTTIKNIVETLEGKILCGDENAEITKGAVNIAASDYEFMKQNISDGDIVILGNRTEHQKYSIDIGAKVLIITGSAFVSDEVVEIAKEKGVIIIKTALTTYMVAKLIGLSVPISHIMSKGNLVTFKEDDLIDDVKNIMANYRYRNFPVVDKNYTYIGSLTKSCLLNADKKNVILVDHNEEKQVVDGIDEANILEIIDHHKINSVKTNGPIYFRNEPLGCTGTIVYKMYKENEVEIDKRTAGLILSAIISDTLLFRSPTCTNQDKKAVEELEKIAGVSKEKYAEEMFIAGSELAGKTDDEIFHTDFKKFDMSGKSIGIAQVTSVNRKELEEIRDRFIKNLDAMREKEQVDMIYIMLTSIFEEVSLLVCAGDNAYTVAKKAFDGSILDDDNENVLVIDKLLSRKKQLVPNITKVL